MLVTFHKLTNDSYEKSTSFRFYKLNVLVLVESTCDQMKPDQLKD